MNVDEDATAGCGTAKDWCCTTDRMVECSFLYSVPYVPMINQGGAAKINMRSYFQPAAQTKNWARE